MRSKKKTPQKAAHDQIVIFPWFLRSYCIYSYYGTSIFKRNSERENSVKPQKDTEGLISSASPKIFDLAFVSAINGSTQPHNNVTG